ncbi:MAG: hypothetical protein SGJ21_12040, partial [Alphaproteobacteria bacterium]|nr:hypothetical protein [Alphaproteobacteria bacterium]
LGVAQRFQFANARPQTNHAGNTFHVELIRGRVVLTASAVRRPQEMVREAIFRRTLARDPQRSFFDEDHPSVELPDDPLYGLVLYGPPSRRADQRFPGFVVVAFPDPQLRYYIDEVDLLNKFAHDHTELVLRLRRDEEIA